MTIIFFGSDPWFSPPVLQALERAGHEILLMVTKGEASDAGRKKKEKERRKTRIIQATKQKDISLERLRYEIFQKTSADRTINYGISQKSDIRIVPDAMILAAFGPPFLSDNVLRWPTYGCFNVHASLLPRWRGASPVFASLREGDRETGVSIMKMTKEIDRGPILGQKRIHIHQPTVVENSRIVFSRVASRGISLSDRPIQPPNIHSNLVATDDQFPRKKILSFSARATRGTCDTCATSHFDTRESLTKRLGLLGGKLIVETLKKLENDQIKYISQPEKSPTQYTRRLTKDSGRIDWSFHAGETDLARCQRIERFIRAVTPWPGAWTEYKEEGKRKKVKGNSIKILKANLQFLYPSSFILLPSLVQLPGKNPISWKQFLAGHPNAILV